MIEPLCLAEPCIVLVLLALHCISAIYLLHKLSTWRSESKSASSYSPLKSTLAYSKSVSPSSSSQVHAPGLRERKVPIIITHNSSITINVSLLVHSTGFAELFVAHQHKESTMAATIHCDWRSPGFAGSSALWMPCHPRNAFPSLTRFAAFPAFP